MAQANSMQIQHSRNTKQRKESALSKFMGGCLYAASRLFLIMYLFLSPLFIEDEMRRVDPTFNIAKLYLPLLAFVKFFFAVMHIVFKSNSKEITRLLLTMIAISAMLLHSPLNTQMTFQDVYVKPEPTPEEDTSSFAFLSEYLPFSIELPIPHILDSSNMASGMTDNVASISINSRNLIAYHWLIVLGVVSSLACHMVNYKKYAAIGRIGLGVFCIGYGVSLLLVHELQRPWMFVLVRYKLLTPQTEHSVLLRVLMMISFTACFAGLTLCRSNEGLKWQKLGIFLAIGYVLVLCIYEAESFVIGLNNAVPEGMGQRDVNVDLQHMLDHGEYWVYPMDYQLLRILHLLMLLSGTVFEMLKIYHPEHALRSQSQYQSLDEQEDAEEEIKEPEVESKGKGKSKGRKSKKKNAKKRRNESKKKK